MKEEENLTRLSGITDNSIEYFHEEDYTKISDLEGISKEDLMEVKYMQEDRADNILESADHALERMQNPDMMFNPAAGEYVEGEPENFTCDCRASFPQLSVYLAHANICDEA